MSSVDVCSIRVVGKMNQYLSQKGIASRCVGCQSANVDSMSESSFVCNDFATCNSQYTSGTNSAVLSEKDIIAIPEGESNNTAHLSQNILPSHSACSANRCSSNERHDRPTCNCNIMKRQNYDSTWQNAVKKYFYLWHLCSILMRYSGNISSWPFTWRTNHRSRSRWIVLFLSFICLCTTLCTADTSECAVGLTTPGRTWPQGDIILEYGQPLRIFCILNKTYVNASFPSVNASNLVFFRNKKEMEPEYITIINETTILMYVEKPPPAEDMYYCKLKLHYSDQHPEAVCLNKVVIGFKPQEPRNFNCISYNWENLTCSWDPVENYVTTKFTLLFKLPGKVGGRKLFPCPKNPQKQLPPNTCLWDTSTNPIYRQPYEYYTLLLDVDNILGHANFTYLFNHYANVIPANPANLSVINRTLNSALLYWSVPFPMQTFPPGIHHKIEYQNQWDRHKDWQVISITEDIHEDKKYFNLTGLKYANTVYDVRVFIKSALATNENRWSISSNIAFRTLSRPPGLPPRTDIGSFEITENNANRDVYIYWQAIPQHEENGDNFTYQIDYVEESGRKISLVPNEITRTYAKFKEISFNNYRFDIVTINAVGASNDRAQIFVPRQRNIPYEPIAFTKIAFDGGLYEVSWKPPITNEEITNYTIFWCDNERDRPYQCTGYLDWVHVSKNTTIYNITVPDPAKIYQFAISANTKRGSSGMIWASCTVIHNKILSKMKSVWINRIGSDFIEVGWKLDCSDRIGIIEGFNIYYCPIISPYNQTCRYPELNSTIKADPRTIHGIVNHLKPYTTYKLAVTVLTKSGEGLRSDILYNTTLEAAPTTPPQNVRITNVTNTTMFITWEPPEAMNGVLRYYEVHYNEHAKKIEEEHHTVLKDLIPYKNYSISVIVCTVSCSEQSPTISEMTKIGVPGKINMPNVRFLNSSQLIVKWNTPQNTAGPLNYYEILTNDAEIQNSTRTEARMPIPDCKTVGREEHYQFRVRAVNIASNNVHLKGPWSESGEGNCYNDGMYLTLWNVMEPGPSFGVWVIIWVIGSLSGVAFLLCLAYTSKRMWLKCKAMQDVEVKLPPGLAPNMKLLQKVSEQHIRQSSADSSGCSSGQESVTSSLTSDSQVSSDSGTEVDAMHVSPNKLLETLPAWESSSLRQRNVGITRPGLNMEATRWEPCVKITKSGEPMLTDALSLARSTPNLTDSTGCTTSQHTWSSTGYISMPSSEELSSNPSPVPKENLNIGSYSIIGAVPKPIRIKLVDVSNKLDIIGDTLISIKPDAIATSSYVTLSSLEQKPKEQQKPIDPLRELDELTFAESNKSKLNVLTSFTASDKISKPYVQTGLMDTFTSHSTDSVRSNVICAPSASTSLTDSCSKPLMSSFASPAPLTASLTISPTKPHVAVSLIPEVTKPSGRVIEATELLPKSCIPTSSTASKPYDLTSSVFQMLQQQKEKTEPSVTAVEDIEREEDALTMYPLCWQTGEKEPIKLDGNKVLTKQKSGYVTITESPELKQQRSTVMPYTQHEQSEKPLPQTTTSQSDEQYSKVTVVPSTIQ